ncbi:hypothetical protein Tco_0276530 [Tanacetum coccineum]
MQKQESLVTDGTALEACLITEGAVMEDCLVNMGRALDDNLVVKETTDDTVTSSEQLDESSSSMNENRRNDADIDIGPSYDSDTVTEVLHSNNDTFDNVFDHEIPKSMNKPENCVYVKIHNEVNREAQQANALLTKELERYKQKENHFAKDMIIESGYCKKIKLLNNEISNLKSQACEKDKTFAKENE